MDGETQRACDYAGGLIAKRIVEALKDKDAGTMYETYARKGIGAEAEDLLELLRRTVLLPCGYGVHSIRVMPDGRNASVTGVKL